MTRGLGPTDRLQPMAAPPWPTTWDNPQMLSSYRHGYRRQRPMTGDGAANLHSDSATVTTWHQYDPTTSLL